MAEGLAGCPRPPRRRHVKPQSNVGAAERRCRRGQGTTGRRKHGSAQASSSGAASSPPGTALASTGRLGRAAGVEQSHLASGIEADLRADEGRARETNEKAGGSTRACGNAGKGRSRPGLTIRMRDSTLDLQGSGRGTAGSGGVGAYGARKGGQRRRRRRGILGDFGAVPTGRREACEAAGPGACVSHPRAEERLLKRLLNMDPMAARAVQVCRNAEQPVRAFSALRRPLGATSRGSLSLAACAVMPHSLAARPWARPKTRGGPRRCVS